MNALKFTESGHGKSKGGFTLIEVLIVLLILAILVGVILMTVSGVFRQTNETAYNSSREEIKNAIVGYAVDHAGNLPTLAGNYSVTGCPTCTIVNISALLTANGGMLSTVPDGMIAIPGNNNDNCDSVTGNISGCSPSFSYVWIIDGLGNLYSTCQGTGCNTSDNGFQQIWP